MNETIIIFHFITNHIQLTQRTIVFISRLMIYIHQEIRHSLSLQFHSTVVNRFVCDLAFSILQKTVINFIIEVKDTVLNYVFFSFKLFTVALLKFISHIVVDKRRK